MRRSCRTEMLKSGHHTEQEVQSDSEHQTDLPAVQQMIQRTEALQKEREKKEKKEKTMKKTLVKSAAFLLCAGLSTSLLPVYAQEGGALLQAASAAELIEALKEEAPNLDVSKDRLELPAVPEGMSLEVSGVDYEQILDEDLNIYHPLTTKTIKVLFKASDGETTVESEEIALEIPGQYTTQSTDNAKPVVIPELAEWKGASGDFVLQEGGRICVRPFDAEVLSEELSAFQEELETLSGLHYEIVSTDDVQPGDLYFALGSQGEGLDEEGYLMNISSCVTVEAETPTAIVWAVKSIEQILVQTGSVLPQGIIRDYPKYEIRSFIVDAGRKSYSLDTLDDITDLMSWYKMNDFQVHLNDNYTNLDTYQNKGTVFTDAAYSAFRLESDIKAGGNDGKNQADLTAKDGSYTKEEFRDFMERSRQKGVDIVPEFDTPAHSLALTKVRPDLALPEGSAKRWADKLDLSNPESMQFVQDLWSEYIEGDDPVFDEDTILHIGTDEFTGDKEQFRKYTDDMIEFVQNTGRTVRVWGSLNECKGETPVRSENVQMNFWSTYRAKPYDMIAQGFSLINTFGYRQYCVPGGPLYNEYLDTEFLYNEFIPNHMDDDIIPTASPQMLGAAYVVWNDYTGREYNGISSFDTLDNFAQALPYFASKVWGDGRDLSYRQMQMAVPFIGYGPTANPYKTTETEQDIVVYDFEQDWTADQSGQGNDILEVNNASAEETETGTALRLNGQSSYLSTGLDGLGPDGEISFRVKPDADSEGEQILFENEEWKFYAALPNGNMGFTRANDTYDFQYALPKGEWTDITLKTYKYATELYVNGEFAKILSKATVSQKFSTLVFPLTRIGSMENAFSGLLDDLHVHSFGFDSMQDFANPAAFTFTATDESSGAARELCNISPWQVWATKAGVLPATLDIDLNREMIIDEVGIQQRMNSYKGNISSYALYYKNDDMEDYALLEEGEWIPACKKEKIKFEPVKASKLRFVAKAGQRDLACVAAVYVMEWDGKDELRSLYKQILDLTQNDCSLNGWNRLLAAQKQALALIHSQSTDAEQIAAMTTALKKAVQGKEDRADTTLLESALEYALQRQAAGLEGLNSLVAAYFEKSIENAQAILAQEDPSQESVNDAWKQLVQSIHMLEFRSEKEALAALVAECEALNLDAFEDGPTKDAFMAALEKARDVLADETALNERINETCDELLQAKNALIPVGFDVSMLELLVATAQAEDLSLYVDGESKDAFLSALESAKAVLDNPESQSQIDESTRSLHTAWLALRRKPDEAVLRELQAFLDELNETDLSVFSLELSSELMGVKAVLEEKLADPQFTREESEELLAQVQDLKARLDEEKAKTGNSATRPDGSAGSVKEETSNSLKTEKDVKKPAGTSASVKTAASVMGQAAGWAAAAGAAALLAGIRRRKNKNTKM